MDKAICEMSLEEIKKEISVRQFELLDFTLDTSYRRWCEDRLCALKIELDMR